MSPWHEYWGCWMMIVAGVKFRSWQTWATGNLKKAEMWQKLCVCLSHSEFNVKSLFQSGFPLLFWQLPYCLLNTLYFPTTLLLLVHSLPEVASFISTKFLPFCFSLLKAFCYHIRHRGPSLPWATIVFSVGNTSLEFGIYFGLSFLCICL